MGVRKRGLFITLEGPEGCGKSTQAARLAARLRAAGCEVVTTREPGGTPLGEGIRDILQHDKAGGDISPLAEVFLFAASRAHLVSAVIRPALDRGACVVCDRFMDSTTAYQGYGRGQDIGAIVRINAAATRGARPDLTLLLDIDVERGFDRLRARNRQRNTGHDRIEREALAFHRRVRSGYRQLARRWPRRFRVVKADRGADEVEAAIWRIVRPALRARGIRRGKGA
jgi:dTMP kinase